MSNKTILATCYAVNPFKGSEDAMGWNVVYQIARFNNVIAITRENNRDAIEKFMIENPDKVYSNITYLYFDLPYWMRFWKKGNWGSMLYFMLWQRGIISFIKKQNLTFDITHNVNFHNDWTPSYLWKLKKPMVWGPIGHHPIIPVHYLKPYSFKYYLKDRATWLVKKAFWNYSFSLKKTVAKADHIFCMNKGVEKVLNLSKKSFSIQPSVATDDFSSNFIYQKTNFHIISVGRFVPLKGFDLTLLSFIKFLENLSDTEKQHCTLTIVGTGPEKAFYKKIIAENNVECYVEIIEWIDRKKLMTLYKKSSVFLFPSHEGAGMVVAEAMSFGLPVICLKNEGPGEFIDSTCGFAVSQTDYNNTILELAEALRILHSDKDLLHKMSIKARVNFQNNFTWNSRGENLNTIYNKLYL
jgi:glycosyltransferase involved in cell wall biosynthesis